jgi:hypothetical protein
MSIPAPILTISREEIPATIPGPGIQTKSEIFPLPLGPYERYMLADDTAAYPMCFVIALDLAGDLRRGPFEAALRATLARHPLFGCLVSRVKGRGWCWVPVPGLAPRLEWQDAEIPAECARGEQIDLTREIGLRIGVHHERARARVSLQFHHATTDGLGSMQFIGDLLAIYGQLTAEAGEDVPELDPLDPELLPGRARVWPTADDPQPNFLARTAGRMLEILSQFPAPIAAPVQTGPRLRSDSQSPAFVSRNFPREVYQGLKAQAAARNVSVNDLLVLEMFQTIREWNRQLGRSRGRAWYRIGVPLSLRTPNDDQLPSANVLSFMFLTRRARDCDAEREDILLQYIHRESELVVRGDSRLMFTYVVRQLAKVPGLLRGLLRVPICQATAILSNVGDVRRSFRARFPTRQGRCVAGNVRLETLLGASPVRHKTRIAVSLGTYAGLLLVNMQCDRRYFAPHEAERLVELFAERIRRRAQCETALKIAS